MTLPRPSTPVSQTGTVSQPRRQLVHVNRKVDVLDQLSRIFGLFFAVGHSPTHSNLEVEPHDQKDHHESNSDGHAF